MSQMMQMTVTVTTYYDFAKNLTKIGYKFNIR